MTKAFRTLLIALFVLGGLAVAQDKGVVSKASLETRLVELQKQRDQLIANLNAYNGAIMETQQWLDKIKAAEEADKAKQPEAKPAEKAAPDK